jgi:hypothetical protein
MPLSTAGKNRALDALAGAASGSAITHVSLHSAIPSDAGSNEISGGSPPYARIPIAFAAATGGTKDKDATTVTFEVPAGTTVTHLGYWTALTGGTFMGYAPVNGGNVDGVATAKNTGDVATSHAHGLVDTNRVQLYTVAGEALPAGLLDTVIYFVVGATADTFQVSLTSGGAPVAITGDGEFYFQQVITETFGSQGNLTVNVAQLNLNV